MTNLPLPQPGPPCPHPSPQPSAEPPLRGDDTKAKKRRGREKATKEAVCSYLCFGRGSVHGSSLVTIQSKNPTVGCAFPHCRGARRVQRGGCGRSLPREEAAAV